MTSVNPLEAAILDHISRGTPAIALLLPGIKVLRRELTGAGSYTYFDCAIPTPRLTDGYLSFHADVSVPGVANGLGAVLACTGGTLDHLEIYTFGMDQWDGTFDGFTIA